MRILVPLKWAATHTEVDPLTGTASVAPGRYGLEPSSLAALQWALALATANAAVVVAVTVGDVDAEAGLREALAAGAAEAHRVDAPGTLAALDVAAALAPLAADAELVVVGARSYDRGSAAVAPALAARLGRVAACGLLAMAWQGRALLAERRLPAGRRERVRVSLPAVVSPEAGTIDVARASLPSLLDAAGAEIGVHRPASALAPAPAGTVRPYRPRPRTVPAPPAGEEPRERIASLTGALEAGSQAQLLELPPDEAAAAIVSALRRWGYLEPEG